MHLSRWKRFLFRSFEGDKTPGWKCTRHVPEFFVDDGGVKAFVGSRRSPKGLFTGVECAAMIGCAQILMRWLLFIILFAFSGCDETPKLKMGRPADPNTPWALHKWENTNRLPPTAQIAANPSTAVMFCWYIEHDSDGYAGYVARGGDGNSAGRPDGFGVFPSLEALANQMKLQGLKPKFVDAEWGAEVPKGWSIRPFTLDEVDELARLTGFKVYASPEVRLKPRESHLFRFKWKI